MVIADKPVDLLRVDLSNINSAFKIGFYSKALMFGASSLLVYYIYSENGIGFYKIKDLLKLDPSE